MTGHLQDLEKATCRPILQPWKLSESYVSM